MFFATALKYYKRPEVQEAILRHAEDREVSPRFSEGFGRRPDTLTYPADVLAFATKKATSFHCSEERWSDPLSIQTGMTRTQLDELRSGWDLVLDIDCPDWKFSKLTTILLIRALEAHGISSITCKFSGSKGFHIGVPFEAFPEEFNNNETKDLFPDAPRAIAEYLIRYIEDPKNRLISVQESAVTFLPQKESVSYSFKELEALCPNEQLLIDVCSSCSAPWEKKKVDSFCPSCQEKIIPDTLRCNACGQIIDQSPDLFSCASCNKSSFPIKKINFAALIEIDTVLLASRHLFRMPYSLHEKTGYVSYPIPASEVLGFEKELASPEKVEYDRTFLARNANPGEAADLLGRSLALMQEEQQEQLQNRKNYEVPEEAIPEEMFPPCMKLILAGLKDGKKRALFILTNFLSTCGWTDEMIKDRVYDWNEVNPEPLREVVIKGHLQLKEKKKEVIPPPNCTSDYYSGLGICQPDDFCKTIKNPAQYSNKKYRMQNPKKKERVKLTEEQKEMRRQHREKMKQKEGENANPEQTE